MSAAMRMAPSPSQVPTAARRAGSLQEPRGADRDQGAEGQLPRPGERREEGVGRIVVGVDDREGERDNDHHDEADGQADPEAYSPLAAATRRNSVG